MNATTIGKFLVVTNLLFSLSMMTMAIGLYANRIDWAGPLPGTGGDGPEGVLTKKRREIDEQTAALRVNLARWLAQRGVLPELEAQRQMLRDFYADQLALLATGKTVKGQAVPNPVKGLIYKVEKREGANVYGLELDAQGRPKLADIPNLKPRDEFAAELKAIDDEIKVAIEKLQKTIDEEIDLTLTLKGEKGKRVGLYPLLDEAEKTMHASQEELTEVNKLRINRQIDAEGYRKRQQQLVARIKELEAKGFVAREPR
jgi:hypothetical protein